MSFVFQNIKGDHYVMAFKRHLQIATGEYDMLIAKSDDVVENVPLVWFQSVSLLLLGTVIAAAFADPLIDAVKNFSSATSIPSFFVSFIAMPLATNSSEAVSAIIFAHRKQKTTASLTFSEVCFSHNFSFSIFWVSDDFFFTPHRALIVSIITNQKTKKGV